MNISLESSFTKFDLTEGEELAGFTFNDANKAVIQNLISDAAEDLVRMSLLSGALTSAEITKIEFQRGAIETLKYLLNTGPMLQQAADQKTLDQQNPDSSV